jgi:serine/threonine protein kinase
VAALPPYALLGAVRTHDVSYPRATWSGVTAEGQALVAAMLQRDPAQRITAAAALAHPWFQRVLGYTPAATGLEKERAEAVSNNVEFSARVAAMHL